MWIEATKKLAALPFNSSPTAWTEERLEKLLSQSEALANACKDISGVCGLAIQIEDDEGTFNDSMGVISRIDEIFLEYGKEEENENGKA